MNNISQHTLWELELEQWGWEWGTTSETLEETLSSLNTGARVVGSATALGQLQLPDTVEVVVLEQAGEELPMVEQTLFVSSPRSLHNLLPFARSTQSQLLFQWVEATASSSDSDDLMARLTDWLFQRAEEGKSSRLYENSQSLLEALKLPTTPERVFEQSLTRLQEALNTLKEQGLLDSWNEVFFQAKIHNTFQFKEAKLLDEPRLLQFWRDYEAMKENLGALDALKLTFFNGREVDLLPLASRMSYTLGELNQILVELDEKGLLPNRLQNKASSHRHEFELQLSASGRTTRSFELWAEAGEQRKALLAVVASSDAFAKQDELQELASLKRPKASHWLDAWQLLSSLEDESAKFGLAGRLLQWQEEDENDGGWMLWALWAQALGLPQLKAEEILALMPSFQEATAELEAPIQSLLSTVPSVTDGFQKVLESLPSTFQFDWLSQDSLNSLVDTAKAEKLWDKAYKLTGQLVEQLPEQGELLRSMAEYSVKLGKRFEVLDWSLQANRLDPNRFPIQPYLNDIREHLFDDLNALREALIELPAHPAFSSLNEELDAREELERELRPVLKDTEALLADNKWEEALTKAQGVLEKHPEHAPFRFQAIVHDVESKKQEMLKALESTPGRDHRQFNKKMEAVSQEAAKLGFADVSRQALEHLVKYNPNYGLGFLKLARITTERGPRDRAFKKAIQLAKAPELRRRNLEEFASVLEAENNLDSLVPLILEMMDNDPARAPRQLEGLLLKVIEKSTKQDKIAKQVNALLDRHNGNIRLNRVKGALQRFEDLDPWKRALLNIKSQR